MNRCIGVPRARDGGSGSFLLDRFGRRLDYLRLSVTDRCNLRCSYCMPKEGVPWVKRSEVLSWEELYHLSEILTGGGVRKIRVTGGEPFVRAGLVPFLSRLRGLPGPPEIVLTTNATLLEGFLGALEEIGLTRINVSLDSLRSDRFRRLTGQDLFSDAWRGIELAMARGFALKLNVVVLDGLNDDEILDFALLSENRDLTVRFIEAMPFAEVACGAGAPMDGDAILNRIRGSLHLERAVQNPGAVEELYHVPSFTGRIGIIRGHSRAFCNKCSRLRINAQGQLRTCLYAEPSLDLRALLRSGAAPEEIRDRIGNAIRKRHFDGWAAQASVENRLPRSMSRIGG